jgi:transcription initiation factor TFIIH subunit 2
MPKRHKLLIPLSARLLRDTTPLQRGIIRHLILVLDLSTAMSEKDLRPTRYLLTLRYAQDFVTEFYEQNPISQLGVIGMRDGLAVRISDMSGNPTQHITAIEALRTQDPKGQPSLQNALDMSRAALFHAPSHGTREVVIVYGALLSSDPGDIHRTIEALVADKIRVRVVGLAAQVAICAELVAKTNAGDVCGLPSTCSPSVSVFLPFSSSLFLSNSLFLFLCICPSPSFQPSLC